MLENSISIDRRFAQNDFNISIVNLRDVEQNILNYMLFSKVNFRRIKNELSEDDFTFLIHKILFKYMLILQDMFLAESYHGLSDLESILEVFADVVAKKESVKVSSILNILSQPPSTNIGKDLEIINANSMEKEIVFNNISVRRSATIETKDGLTWLEFVNDRLVSVGTTNIAILPTEVHDNFIDTIGSLSKLDLQNADNEVSMTLYGDPANPDGIESFYLKKDVAELKWFDDICQWADKYALDETTFPRDRFQLKDLVKLDISDKGINELPKEIGNLANLKILVVDNNNIKEFPSELYQLKDLGLLSCMKNEISYISEDIINLQKLLMFAACHNNISLLPSSFFKLKNLMSFCLHGNKLTTLSSDIANLSNLTSIAISNNDISVLPQSLSKLENLESLDIENTQITEIPMEFLKHRTLNKLSINDDLLPFVAQNIQYLDVDTINLTASHQDESSEIVQALNFKVDNESWVEDRDKKNNGCVQLSKCVEKEE